MNPLLLMILFVAAAGGVAYYALRSSNSDLRDRVAAIDASAGMSKKDQQSTLLRRLLDERRANALSVKLQEAGWYDVTPQKLFVRCLTGLAIGGAVGFLAMLYFHKFSPVFIGLCAALAAYGAYSPYAKLHRTIDKRKISIHRELPDFLDVLATTVDAGIALNGALSAACEGLNGPLGDEMKAALQDIRLGRSRADALTALAQRVREPDLTTTMVAIVQSERLGASITEVLQQLAAETRERRTLRAEEIAAQPAQQTRLSRRVMHASGTAAADLRSGRGQADQQMIADVLSAIVFACAAACGIAIAQMLCADLTPLDGAPEPGRLSPAIPIAAFSALGLIMAMRGAGVTQLGIVALIGVPLSGSWYADAKKGIVPDLFTIVPLAIILIAVCLHHSWFVAVSALVTGGAFGAAALLSRGRGMGWGDAKLAAIAGALLGLPWSLGVLGAACFAATLVSVIRNRGTQPIAFAPYIVVSVLLAVAITVHS